jgi:DNA transformation protein
MVGYGPPALSTLRIADESIMAVSESLVALLQEQLHPLGRIAFRRMFNGAGLYCDGVIFGLILRDALHFRVDDSNRAAYQAEGMGPFSYAAKGRIVEVGAYWRVPERLLDEPDEMVGWARAALAAGRRASARKADKSSKKSMAERKPRTGGRGRAKRA